MLLKQSKKTKGFSLIQLMLTVAIIGIVVAIVIPNFLKYQRKSRQAEAKTNLESIYTLEVAYHTKNNKYDGDLASIGWAPKGTTRYAYTVDVNVDADSFLATATGNPDGQGNPDVWTMNQNKTLVNVVPKDSATE
jgi:type IV pilus assembly protein PilA